MKPPEPLECPRTCLKFPRHCLKFPGHSGILELPKKPKRQSGIFRRSLACGFAPAAPLFFICFIIIAAYMAGGV